VADWLASRALQLDAATGQLPDSLQLLELAASKGFAGFTPASLASSSGMRRASEAAAAAAAAGQQEGVTIAVLLTQARVLMHLLKSWWPVQDEQQQQLLRPPEQQQQAGDAAAAVASDAAAAASLQPLWAVTLRQWVTVGLLPQLLAVLGGSSRDLLQHDLVERCAGGELSLGPHSSSNSMLPCMHTTPHHTPFTPVLSCACVCAVTGWCRCCLATHASSR
jgi:hypothetical protein